MIYDKELQYAKESFGSFKYKTVQVHYGPYMEIW